MSHTILVVDDESGLREVLRILLEGAGYRVVDVEDGQEALEIVEVSRPDLVLLDLMMPRLDGAGFLRELDRRGLRQNLPVVLMSAAHNLWQSSYALSVERCLTKPFDLADLLRIVAEQVRPGAPATG